MAKFKVGDLIWSAYYGFGKVLEIHRHSDGSVSGHRCEYADGIKDVATEPVGYEPSDFGALLMLEKDSTIRSAIKAFDCYNLPLEHREMGDTAAFDYFMKFTSNNDLLISKMLVANVLFREAIRRGMQIEFNV